MAIMFYVWLGVLILTIIIEISTVDLTSIWFSIGSVPALLISILYTGRWTVYFQIIAFGVVATLSIIFLRPLLKKKIDTPTIATNVDSLINKIAIVETEIRPNVPGSVKLEGIEWTAISEEELNPGDLSVVLEINGNTLTVTKNQKGEN